MPFTRPVVGAEVSAADFGQPAYDRIIALGSGWTVATSATTTVAHSGSGTTPLSGWTLGPNGAGITVATERLVCSVAGVYLFLWSLAFSSNATGTIRGAVLYRLGANLSAGGASSQAVPASTPTSGIGMGLSGSAHAVMAAGEHVTLEGRQDSGAGLGCTGRVLVKRIDPA